MSASPATEPEGRGSSRAFAIDTAVVAVTQLIVRLRGLVLLPLMVKTLGTAAYGAWAQVGAFAMFLSALVCLNMHLPLVREIAADHARAATVYVSLFLATCAISILSACVLAAIPGPIATLLLGDASAARFISLGLLLMIANNLRLLNVNLYRATGRLVVRSGVELSTAIGEIVGIVIVLETGGRLEDVLVFMVAWNGAVAIVQSAHCFAITGWGAPRSDIVRAALAYALPLIPASFANFALDRVDRFVVGYYEGAHGVGIYAANYALGGLVMMAQAPFQMTLLPKVAELWDRDRARAARYIEVSLMVFLTLAIPSVAGAGMIAEPALRLLGNDEMADSAGWTTFLIAAGVLCWGWALIQAQAFYGARRTGTWGAITLSATILNLVMNIALVPWLGVQGAALATLLAYGAILALAMGFGRPLLAIRLDGRHLVTCALAAGVMSAFVRGLAPGSGAELALVVGGAIVIYGALVIALPALLPPLRGDTVQRVATVLRSFRSAR